MSEPKLPKKFAVANGPVNARTKQLAQRPPLPAQPVVVQARVQAALARQRLGASLASRLAALDAIHADSGLSGAAETFSGPQSVTGAVVAAIGCAVSGTGVLLGLIQKSELLTVTSVILLACFGLWAAARIRVRRAHRAREVTGGVFGGAAQNMSAWHNVDDVAQLDALMAQLTAQSANDVADRLASLKESIVRCLSLMKGLQAQISLQNDDSLFVNECVRRYIPDSIRSCLQVPQADRATLVIDGTQTAIGLLHSQLELIASQLDARQQRLTQLAGESLMRQQRFLAAKTGAKI